jgi:queuosine precursor transporter
MMQLHDADKTMGAGRHAALLWLALAHVSVILASNYLVQIPLQVGPVLTTWGSFTFPLIFLATDLTVRVLGRDTARRVVLWAMGPALVASYVVSVLFAEGRFAGWASLSEFNLFVFRIACASFAAYVVGQITDIQVFARLQGRGRWWVAPAFSTVVGGFIDTLVFFAAAFYLSPDPFMAAHWPELAATDYATKMAVSLAFYLPVYGSTVGWFVSRLAVPPPPRLV